MINFIDNSLRLCGSIRAIIICYELVVFQIEIKCNASRFYEHILLSVQLESNYDILPLGQGAIHFQCETFEHHRSFKL